MADYKVTDTEMISVANAIRTKGGTSAQLEWPTGFANAVAAIPSGGSATLIEKSVTQNGTYNASSDNADGYSKVVVNVSGGGGSLIPGAVRLTPYEEDNATGYVDTNGNWLAYQANYQDIRSDFYRLDPADGAFRYFLVFIADVTNSNRFRISVIDTDPTTLTPNVETKIFGEAARYLPQGASSYYNFTNIDLLEAPTGALLRINDITSTKYLLIGKTNRNVNGIQSYVIDITPIVL